MKLDSFAAQPIRFDEDSPGFTPCSIRPYAAPDRAKNATTKPFDLYIQHTSMKRTHFGRQRKSIQFSKNGGSVWESASSYLGGNKDFA